MVFQLASSLMSPAVKGVYNTLKTLFDHFIFQRAVAKSNFKCTIDIIPEALIISEHLQDCCSRSKRMLCPVKQAQYQRVK
jgi:hypothetical protein